MNAVALLRYEAERLANDEIPSDEYYAQLRQVYIKLKPQQKAQMLAIIYERKVQLKIIVERDYAGN